MTALRQLGLVGLGALALAGCKVLNTSDGENVQGRGAQAFDPYAGPASGVIRLSLQMVNGCAILGTGEPVGKNSLNIPYPDNCDGGQLPPHQAPTPEPMQLLTDTDYFLHQFTVMDSVMNQHNDPRDMASVMKWFKNETRLKNLDWQNLSITSDSWQPNYQFVAPAAFIHKVGFGGANWMTKQGDTFTVEILDADGRVRQTQTYDRKGFLSENPISGHTQLGWEHRNIGAPRHPGDLEPQPVKDVGPGHFPANPEATKTFARFSMVMSTQPHRKLNVPKELAGDGALRVTWSQLPGEPFYFPVRFLRSEEVAQTCYSGENPSQRVACGFGLQPEAKLNTPKNGKYFEPGEQVFYKLAVKDGHGNYLHHPDWFPTWNEYAQDQANGLMYASTHHYFTLHEQDTATGAKIVGPIHKLTTYYDEVSSPFFQFPAQDVNWISDFLNGDNGIPGGRSNRPPTLWNVKLPQNAEPGTYALIWKVHRQFMGERFTKTEVFHFPVGQEEPTPYPGQVGNCQICHRAQMSLENVRHGMSVDHVESCKACHNRDIVPAQRLFAMQGLIHQVHMTSEKYPTSKNDCSVCHLTKASTLRPSMVVCGACHPAPHGGHFDGLVTTTNIEPGSVFGNCASACHVNTPPTGHIYPEQ